MHSFSLSTVVTERQILLENVSGSILFEEWILCRLSDHFFREIPTGRKIALFNRAEQKMGTGEFQNFFWSAYIFYRTQRETSVVIKGFCLIWLIMKRFDPWRTANHSTEKTLQTFPTSIRGRRGRRGWGHIQFDSTTCAHIKLQLLFVVTAETPYPNLKLRLVNSRKIALVWKERHECICCRMQYSKILINIFVEPFLVYDNYFNDTSTLFSMWLRGL